MIVLITGVSADFSPESRTFDRPACYLRYILHNHVAIHCSDWDMLLRAASATHRWGTLQRKVKWQLGAGDFVNELDGCDLRTRKRNALLQCRIWYYIESVEPFCINGINLSCGSVTCVWINVDTYVEEVGLQANQIVMIKHPSKQEIKHTHNW